MSAAYERLEREVRKPRPMHDWTSVWDRLTPIANANDAARVDIARFLKRKRITFEALEALGTRVVNRGDIGYCLAYAGTNGLPGDVIRLLQGEAVFSLRPRLALPACLTHGRPVALG
jgi:hypothetical protein